MLFFGFLTCSVLYSLGSLLLLSESGQLISFQPGLVLEHIHTPHPKPKAANFKHNNSGEQTDENTSLEHWRDTIALRICYIILRGREGLVKHCGMIAWYVGMCCLHPMIISFIAVGTHLRHGFVHAHLPMCAHMPFITCTCLCTAKHKHAHS